MFVNLYFVTQSVPKNLKTFLIIYMRDFERFNVMKCTQSSRAMKIFAFEQRPHAKQYLMRETKYFGSIPR